MLAASILKYVFIIVTCCKELILLLLLPFYGPLDFVRDYLGQPVPEGKTRKIKLTWIYWSKRQ